ncbi:MAG: hypothetical protein K9M99_02565 [Candidatus Cloacimonetes bacterium]|nr:hypothetical protein [Candidatus Cloacimonadota bacterium]
MKYKIKIEDVNRHKIRVETAKEFTSSYFSSIYRRAAISIKEIVNWTNSDNTNETNCFNTNQDININKAYSNCDNYQEPVNNIIVFSGDRGSGKSSALASFVQELRCKRSRFIEKEDEQIKDLYELLKCKSFHVMDTIDPSHFTPDQNILYVIISTIFHEFTEKIDANPGRNKQIDKILDKFDSTFKAIQNIDLKHSGEVLFESIERLDELGDSLKLKGTIHDLIQLYLNFLNDNDSNNNSQKNSKCKYDFFVIPIDDLDMNVDHAFEMLEQIRKFLIQDNIIILMAANINQLHLEIEEHYYDYFERRINTRYERNIREIDVKKMASGYMSKIIPPSRRLEIPHLYLDFDEIQLEILKDNKEKFASPNSNLSPGGSGSNNGNNTNRPESLQQKILRIIWERTGLIFIPEDNQLHPIIPSNLRALHQLVFLLVSMKDTKLPTIKSANNQESLTTKKERTHTAYQDDINNGKTLIENFYKFKEYVMTYWIPFHLASKQQAIFENLPTDLNRINKYLLQSINAVGNHFKEKIVIKEVELEDRFPDDKMKSKEKEIHEYLFTLEDCYIKNKDEVNCNDIINSKSNLKNKLEKLYWIRRSLSIKPYKISPVDRDIYTMVSVNDPHFFDANKISDPFNYTSNNSMGDILLLINKYEVYFESQEALSFISAVKIYYSMLLFESMFIKSKLEPPKKENNKIDLSEFNLENKVMPIQLLIGGTTYFAHSADLVQTTIPTKKLEDNEHQFYFSVDYTKFENIEGNGVIPYFFLYYGRRRPARPYPRHIYDTTWKSGQSMKEKEDRDKARFDILSFLVNTINPYRTYRRFDKIEAKPEFTEALIKWIEKNQFIGSKDNKKLYPIPFLPLYSIDIMLRLINYRYIDSEDLNDSDSTGEYGFRKVVKKYYDRIERKTVEWIQQNQGDTASKLIDTIIKGNPIEESWETDVFDFLDDFYPKSDS